MIHHREVIYGQCLFHIIISCASNPIPACQNRLGYLIDISPQHLNGFHLKYIRRFGKKCKVDWNNAAFDSPLTYVIRKTHKMQYAITVSYMINMVMKVYPNIRELREDHDLSQKVLANLLNVSQATYSRYETGDLDIPSKSLIKLSEFYDVSVDYLLGKTKKKKQ